ncbi:FliM/FliN family flagellar motor switch protein [Rhodobacteraceae bacterium 63075]|nr:FliM/FliN family flagellar motor switch protein [Rhodobacteraceae bacterium 63075]
MSESEDIDVLRRKARAGRAGHEARVMSPARALRSALARAAEAQFELALAVSGVQSEQLMQEAMLRCVDDEMLFVVLDGPQGAVGAVALDTNVVAGFIECQTIGTVSARKGPERAPTATDAALVAPFIDMMLTEMTEGLGAEGAALTGGFSYGARIESKRHLQLIADAGEYRVMRAQLELAGGAKRGELVLVLPVAEARPGPADSSRKRGADAGPEAQAAGAEPAAKRLLGEGALMDAGAVLRAVISRQRMSLSEFSALATGDVLTLPGRAFDAVEIDAGAGSERLGPCKLGQFEGLRAVQLRFGGRRPDGREGFEGLMPETDEWGAPPVLHGGAALGGEAGQDGLPDLSDLPGFEDFDPDAEPDASHDASESETTDSSAESGGAPLGRTG